jgi:RimJ/RimL family protein N-acetyltransferase
MNGLRLARLSDLAQIMDVVKDAREFLKAQNSGQWRFPALYLVIHRFAVRSDYHAQGIATKILQAVELIAGERNIHTIRVDTHELNIPMIGLLEKNGFAKCGEVLIEGIKPRITFDKKI